MTTHELARQLLAMDDVPVVHVYTHFDNFDDYPKECISEVGINLLKNGEGVLREVGLYPEDVISVTTLDFEEEE